jgi:hypothetical protein
MKNTFYNENWKYVFKFEEWVEAHKPKKKLSGEFWEEIYLEYDDVIAEFKNLLFSSDDVVDKDGNKLTPINLYNLIDKYKIRVEKLMLIFNVRLYKTLNENKKSGIKYIVMRAFWIDHLGKNVRWFSRNIGPENKVLVNGTIPLHHLEEIEKDILFLMWGQYQIEYLGAEETGYDSDGNEILVEY